MQVAKSTFVNNGRDFDLSITSDSNVVLDQIKSYGAKFESISIKEYRYGIDAAREKIVQLPLSSSDQAFVLDRLKVLENGKDVGLLQKVLNEICSVVRSVPGNVVANIIATLILNNGK